MLAVRADQQAELEADPAYWTRLAEELDAAGCPEEAQACRNAAVVAEMEAANLTYTDPDGQRGLRLIPGTEGVPRRTRWLWADRFPVGTLALLAGPGGAGKSTVAYWLAAQITRGVLPGEWLGTPRAVIICSTEDTWDEIIMPRLMAANADISQTYRVEPLTGELSLPRDLDGLRRLATKVNAALLIMDPIISRLGRKLDTHKDSETRQALEPLTGMAADIRMGVLGLIHFSKAATSDVVGQVMASAAFPNVARSVHVVMRDPAEANAGRRLFGTPKNNMGRDDLPTMAFTISTEVVGQDPDDGSDVTASRIDWLGDSYISIQDAHTASHDRETRGTDAAQLLRQMLDAGGGVVEAREVKRIARDDGISESTLHRARRNMGLVTQPHPAEPTRTLWVDPVTLPSHALGE